MNQNPQINLTENVVWWITTATQLCEGEDPHLRRCGVDYASACHPERSEGSLVFATREILRFAQNDKLSAQNDKLSAQDDKLSAQNDMPFTQ